MQQIFIAIQPVLSKKEHEKNGRQCFILYDVFFGPLHCFLLFSVPFFGKTHVSWTYNKVNFLLYRFYWWLYIVSMQIDSRGGALDELQHFLNKYVPLSACERKYAGCNSLLEQSLYLNYETLFHSHKWRGARIKFYVRHILCLFNRIFTCDK